MADLMVDVSLKKLQKFDGGPVEKGRQYLASHNDRLKLMMVWVTQYGDTREREGRKAAREKNAELLNALGLMYGQYCSKKLGHDFMGAGEAAIELLEEYGIHDEYSEWSDKTYEKLEQVVAELKEEV